MTCLQVRDLSFGHPHVQLFSQWSALFCPGLTWVTGEESVGKTTLMRLLSGEWTPQQGAVGWPQPTGWRDLSPAEVYWVDPGTTAHDGQTALSFWQTCRARYPGWSTSDLSRWTAAFSLTEHVDKPLYMLSTGSKRKVWLAGALAAHASLTLLDEPEAALDLPSRQALRQQLTQAALSKQAVWLVASHHCPVDVPPQQTLRLV